MSGIALGISPSGALLVRDTEGRLQTVTSGTVRLETADPPAA
jgi:biotin-(acetyl-CoA carboxylase) ligase